MALYHEDIIDIDLDCGTVHRSFAHKMLGEGDNNGNRYGVRIWRKGEPVNIGGGTCIGYFIRYPSGDTVVINGGTFAGNEAFVTLPASCYVYNGSFTLVIKLVGGNVAGTMRVIDGTVIDAIIGTPVDPGTTVPDLTELMAVIGRVEAAAQRIRTLDIHAELIEDENYAIVVNRGS